MSYFWAALMEGSSRSSTEWKWKQTWHQVGNLWEGEHDHLSGREGQVNAFWSFYLECTFHSFQVKKKKKTQEAEKKTFLSKDGLLVRHRRPAEGEGRIVDSGQQGLCGLRWNPGYATGGSHLEVCSGLLRYPDQGPRVAGTWVLSLDSFCQTTRIVLPIKVHKNVMWNDRVSCVTF